MAAQLKTTAWREARHSPTPYAHELVVRVRLHTKRRLGDSVVRLVLPVRVAPEVERASVAVLVRAGRRQAGDPARGALLDVRRPLRPVEVANHELARAGPPTMLEENDRLGGADLQVVRLVRHEPRGEAALDGEEPAIRIVQHEHFVVARVVEGVTDPFLLHEPMCKVEVALLVLNAVLAPRVESRRGEQQRAAVPRQIRRQHYRENLGHHHVLEDAALATEPEHPERWNEDHARPCARRVVVAVVDLAHPPTKAARAPASVHSQRAVAAQEPRHVVLRLSLVRGRDEQLDLVGLVQGLDDPKLRHRQLHSGKGSRLELVKDVEQRACGGVQVLPRCRKMGMSRALPKLSSGSPIITQRSHGRQRSPSTDGSSGRACEARRPAWACRGAP